MDHILEDEMRTYNNNLDSLIGSAQGKYVLIHDSRILGIFDTQMDAVRRGYTELGNVPFLVKQIAEIDTPLNFVSNLLGV